MAKCKTAEQRVYFGVASKLSFVTTRRDDKSIGCLYWHLQLMGHQLFTLVEVKRTNTHKVVDYITHWPLGTPVNIIDSHRILALPKGFHGRILFPVRLPPSFSASALLPPSHYSTSNLYQI